MFGVLTIAVRIYHDRGGYGVYSGPIGAAVLIIATKWVRTAWACPPPPSPLRLGLPVYLPVSLKHGDNEHWAPPPHRHARALDLSQVTSLLCLSFYVCEVIITIVA